MKPLHVVILAAGEGKRMKSALPKVLQPIAGRPMLGHVIDAARALSPAGVHVVYGHGGDAVQAAFAGGQHFLQPERFAFHDLAHVNTQRPRQQGEQYDVQQALPDHVFHNVLLWGLNLAHGNTV